jgi:uncharacterized protein YcfJ
MNKPMLTGVLLGAALATAGGVFSGYRLLHDEEPAAWVAAVSQTCTDEILADSGDSEDEHGIAGTLLGAFAEDALDTKTHCIPIEH